MSEYNTTDSVSLGAHLKGLKAMVSEAWTSEDAVKIAAVREKIVLLNNLASETRSLFDGFIDNRDAGAFGSDFVTEVTRIRAKSDKVGRPAKVKVDKADLI